ncbi:MAG: hypothetical protein J6Y92_06980 [Lentisphaeria bacterium]|nr:hypothetical protein [Lentisphaeria bacterium]
MKKIGVDYFHCRERFLALPGVLEVRKGPYRFAVPPGPAQDYLAEHFAESDAMIRDGAHAKVSWASSASVWTLPGGQKIFVKRNRVHGFEYTFKYFFIPARAFRAAVAAQRVEAAGIMTPRVLAAGERRFAHFLLAGYLVTDALTDARDLMSYVIERPDAPAGMPAVIREVARVAAVLHGHGFYHGDLKLVNLYRTADDAPCGVWDLDSAQLFPGEVPHELVVRELGRIVSSVLIFAEQNPAFPDEFFDLDRVTDDLLDAYSAAAKTPAPAASEVMDVARVRWLNKRKLRFDYGGHHA